MAYRETGRVKARKKAQHEALLRQAEAMVRDGGFEALTMQDLARGCGLAVGTVYRYFDGKDALACAVFSVATEREIAAVKAAIASAAQPHDALVAGLEVFARRALRAPRLAWALIAEPVAPALDSARLRYREHWTALFAGVIAEGTRLGSWPAQQAGLTAAAMVGALAEALVGPLSRVSQARRTPLNDTALVNDLVQFCIRATGSPVAAASRNPGDEQQA